MTKLHLGCGKRNFGSEWVHIDGGDHPHLHSHDIVNLPFDNCSVDLIYCSHVLEYFDREEVKVVLKEWHRVLKPSSLLRIAVPDFKTMAKLYVSQEFKLESFLGPLYGKMQMGENFIYHKTVYDFESLKLILQFCGFSDVELYDWRKTEHCHLDDQSQAYLPKMDKENGTLISLNVEAKRK